ncbi:putative 60S acidic ribosomal protein P2 [Trypanosoma theileri]|uniref:Putative 60S acidic ribosomal protein P2 n=1 Tax=Trypanosoma theileri TaxID=67003 RepID=A0A1X0P9L8_9TRYP|nr:putative 60S acidic ribosomal protein P2 [Trypanosoma theileri]XP_028887399.1 putative 60S acidic ribosomal protein P2 [Trypanosoma theileri]ORC93332.1 putative 60S acidic ribosomal protein P2 [Trypanosoma theileri]ORC93333.1 putative 60S acidic ribosomal protein P2 [Trypanosoma theileri]
MSGTINPNDTLACTYACLLLSDAGVPVTSENIEAACKAAGMSVRNTLPILFARFLEKKPMETLLTAALSAAPQPGAAAAAAPAAAAGGAAAAAPAAAKKAEKEEEEDDDMGFGLFD